MTDVLAVPLRSERRPWFAVVATIVAAWALLLASHGWGAYSHDAVFEGGGPEGVLLFLAGWELMVIAMMLPLSLPALRGLGQIPPGGFLAGVAILWAGFGIAALTVDSTVHRTADGLPWLAARPSLVAAGLLVLVGAAQFVPLKGRCLLEARHWTATGQDSAVHQGLRYGLVGMGCDGGLMLLMFAVGMGNVLWMVLLAVVMAAERTSGRPLRRPVHQWIGAALITAGVVAA